MQLMEPKLWRAPPAENVRGAAASLGMLRAKRERQTYVSLLLDMFANRCWNG